MTVTPSRINPFLCCQEAAEKDQATRSEQQEVDTKTGEEVNDIENTIIADQDPNNKASEVSAALQQLQNDVKAMTGASSSSMPALSAKASADQAALQALTASLGNTQQQADAASQKAENTAGNTDTSNLAQVTQLMTAQNTTMSTTAQILVSG